LHQLSCVIVLNYYSFLLLCNPISGYAAAYGNSEPTYTGMYGNPDATYTAQAYPDAYSTNQVCLLAL
jgi:hypothetical protein